MELAIVISKTTIAKHVVENPAGHHQVSAETRCLVDCLLSEKLPLVAIGRSAKFSESWLQHYVMQKYQ